MLDNLKKCITCPKKCLTCLIFTYKDTISVLLLLIVILFVVILGKDLFNEYGTACQSAGALANIIIVYCLYKLTRKDQINDYQRELDRKWYTEIIVPNFKKIFSEILNVNYNEVRELLDKGDWDKENLLKIISTYSYKENQILNELAYFNNKLHNEMKNKIDDFYDGKTQEIADKDLVTETDLKEYMQSLNSHMIDVMSILYRNGKKL